MTFQKGVSGNPQGKQSSPWRLALKAAVKQPSTKGEWSVLHDIAKACVEAALAGDMNAIKEIGDRLDGKPKQRVEGMSVTANVLMIDGRPATADELRASIRQITERLGHGVIDAIPDGADGT